MGIVLTFKISTSQGTAEQTGSKMGNISCTEEGKGGR